MTTLSLAAPAIAGPLAVFPLFASPGALRYVSFAEGVARGVVVKELDEGANVNALLVVNPLDVPVLLYEGEQVLGAQQNRTFDVSVLVGAGTKVRVPVSCVEAGRWDGARHGEAFAPAPQAAHPELRSLKAEAGRGRQTAVWDAVAAKAAAFGVASPTSALSDVFEHRGSDVRGVADAIDRHEGQVGALAAIGGRFVVLDRVSEPEVWAALHGPLVQGYALDALDAKGGAPPSSDEALAFLARLDAAPLHVGATAGLGEGVRFDVGDVAGAGVRCDGELVALTAYTPRRP